MQGIILKFCTLEGYCMNFACCKILYSCTCTKTAISAPICPFCIALCKDLQDKWFTAMNCKCHHSHVCVQVIYRTHSTLIMKLRLQILPSSQIRVLHWSCNLYIEMPSVLHNNVWPLKVIMLTAYCQFLNYVCYFCFFLEILTCCTSYPFI